MSNSQTQKSVNIEKTNNGMFKIFPPSQLVRYLVFVNISYSWPVITLWGAQGGLALTIWNNELFIMNLSLTQSGLASHSTDKTNRTFKQKIIGLLITIITEVIINFQKLYKLFFVRSSSSSLPGSDGKKRTDKISLYRTGRLSRLCMLIV